MQNKNQTREVNLILLTDSRGKGLDSFIRKCEILPNLPNCKINIEVDCRPGSTLEAVSRRAKHVARRRAVDYIIIFAGICSFTRKNIVNNSVKLDYPNDNKKELAISIIDDLLKLLGSKIHVGTVPPADIIKFNKYRNPECEVKQEEIQSKLVTDIEALNSHIVNSNITRDSPTLLTAKQTYESSTRKDKRSGKKKIIRKFSSKNLDDGIHANKKLEKLWFERIVTFIYQLIRKDIEAEQESSHKKIKLSPQRKVLLRKDFNT